MLSNTYCNRECLMIPVTMRENQVFFLTDKEICLTIAAADVTSINVKLSSIYSYGAELITVAHVMTS